MGSPSVRKGADDGEPLGPCGARPSGVEQSEYCHLTTDNVAGQVGKEGGIDLICRGNMLLC